MATQGQQLAQDWVNKVNNSSVSDYIPAAGQFSYNDPFLAGVPANIRDFVAADPEYYGSLSGDDVSQNTLQPIINRLVAKYSGANSTANAQIAQNSDKQLAQNNVDWWNAHPNGDDSWFDKAMGVAIPALAGGIFGAGALGAMGMGPLAGGASSGAVDAGLGSLGSSIPLDTGALTDMGWASGLGGGATNAAAGAAGLGGLGDAGLAGLGSGALDSSIPTVVVNGSTAGATSGLGAGAVLGAGAGIGAIAGLGNTPIPTDPSLQNLPDLTQSAPPNNPDIPVVTVTGQRPTDNTNSTTNYTPPFVPIPLQPGVSDLPNVTSSGNTTGGSTTPTGTGTPSLGDILGGLGTIAGGVIGSQQQGNDQAYWQNYMDKLTSMYNPGTPEADLLQHQMEAKDAAAGRNSQYGVRATNLAAMLAQQRANIMTSPTFYNMGAASRGHYDNIPNGLFNILGSAMQSGSSLNNMLGGIGNSISNGLSSLFGNSSSTTTPPVR